MLRRRRSAKPSVQAPVGEPLMVARVLATARAMPRRVQVYKISGVNLAERLAPVAVAYFCPAAQEGGDALQIAAKRLRLAADPSHIRGLVEVSRAVKAHRGP